MTKPALLVHLRAKPGKEEALAAFLAGARALAAASSRLSAWFAMPWAETPSPSSTPSRMKRAARRTSTARSSRRDGAGRRAAADRPRSTGWTSWRTPCRCDRPAPRHRGLSITARPDTAPAPAPNMSKVKSSVAPVAVVMAPVAPSAVRADSPKPPPQERCYGVATAGRNDCKAGPGVTPPGCRLLTRPA